MRGLLVFLGTLAAPAQNGPAPEVVFRSDTRLVALNVSVLDAAGKIVRGLPRSAFTVYEDDVRQTVSVFRQEDVPVSLGLVLDNSASMRPKRERVASAALALVRASNPADEVFVVNFNEDAVIAQEFTSDIARLERALRSPDARGQTAMRDALRLSLEHLKVRSKKD
jgi:VWFA-related protein